LSNKKTSKAEKRSRDRRLILFELSILLPAFSYMYSIYKISIDENKEDDYTNILKRLTKKIALTTKTYKSLHEEAVRISNSVIEDEEINKCNYFMFAVTLLDIHYKLKGKKLHIGLFDDFLEIQSVVVDELDSDILKISEEYADLVYLKLREEFKDVL